MPPSIPLSAHLPPLIMGTATFNSQYNADPYALPTTELVQRALARGVRAFDTSPYYGPAEELLGAALATEHVQRQHPRSTYRLLTKVGRIAAGSFDYSPAWIRHSVQHSLARLHTSYLDVVYCHDVEFVSAAEVVGAVRELRRLRDEHAGMVRYIGISGYPVDRLCDLAETVLRETGEPLDAVMSYANFTLQNTRLRSRALPRLLAAGVDVVPNASPLGMGLLRRDGVPIGSMGDFHPAPDPLRHAIRRAADCAARHGEKLEVVAIRFALESWLRAGSSAGALGPPLARGPDADPGFLSAAHVGTGHRLGVSVMGVSSVAELDETLRVWHSILDGLESQDEEEDEGSGANSAPAIPSTNLFDIDKNKKKEKHDTLLPDTCPSFSPSTPSATNIPTPSEDQITDHAWSRARRAHIQQLAGEIRDIIGREWIDYVWASPPADFVNFLSEEHVAAVRRMEAAEVEAGLKGGGRSAAAPAAAGDSSSTAMLTPPLDAKT